ncbi:hypothetical protein NOZE110980_19100 [Nocardioides zeicaulis]
MHHRGDLRGGAEHLDGLAVPCLALFGQGAWFVLGVAGLECRLLGELEGFDRCRRPPMRSLEVDDQDSAPRLDAGTPPREPGVQPRVDTDDLAHRVLASIRASPVGRAFTALLEPNTERIGQVAFEGGVVGLGRRHDGLVQRSPVDRQPLPSHGSGDWGDGFDLVGDGDVGVEVGVAGARVAVGERGRDQPADVDLPHAVGALARVERGGLEEGEGVVDGGLVRAFDDHSGGGVGDRPERRDALDGGEGEVVPGDGRGLRAGVLGDGGGELAGPVGSGGGVATVLGAEEVASDLGAHPGTFRGGYRIVGAHSVVGVDGGEPLGDLDPERADVVVVHLERRPKTSHCPVLSVGRAGESWPADAEVKGVGAGRGERVVAGAEQVLHLLGGHHVAGVEAVDAGHPGPDPDAGHFALLGVVRRESDVALVGGVERGDLPSQVVVPRPGGELVQAHGHPHLRARLRPRRSPARQCARVGTPTVIGGDQPAMQEVCVASFFCPSAGGCTAARAGRGLRTPLAGILLGPNLVNAG